MEPICHGWLIKSPPKQKSSGAWKIFGAKWKRRYFVLYAPPLTSAIIGARAAMLEYYSSKKMNTKVGAINLEDCDEVLSNLDSDIYKNIFGLHTKHKGRDRTYYLVADTEMEMNSWVSNLCSVLGLLENDENKFKFSPESRAKSASCILSKPRPNFLTHPNRKNTTSMAISLSSESGFSSLSSRLNSSESNLLDSKLYNEESEGGLKSSGSVPELESVRTIPVPAKKRENMELPPVPPEKTRKSLEDLISDRTIGTVQIAPVSNLMAEECLGMPPPKPPKEKKRDRKAQEEYNVPKPLEVDNQSYDLPKMNLQSTDSTNNIQSEAIVYNAPKAYVSQNSLENPTLINMRQPPIPARRKSVLSKNLRDTNAAPDDEFYCAPKSNAILLGGTESSSNVGSFDNVLPSHSVLGRDGGPPSDHADPSYDVPNLSSEEIQPIKGRKAEKLQKNIYNAPMSNDNDEMYDAPKNAFKPVPAKRTQIASQSTSPPCDPTSPKKPILPSKPKVDKKQISTKLSESTNGDFQTYSTPRTGAQLETTQSFQKKTSAQVVIENSIRFTQRSKSFKRSLNGPESNEKQMPTKRINEKEASSDDCDSDDEN